MRKTHPVGHDEILSAPVGPGGENDAGERAVEHAYRVNAAPFGQKHVRQHELRQQRDTHYG